MKELVAFVATLAAACGSPATKQETLSHNAPTEAPATTDEEKPPTSVSPPARSVDSWIAQLEDASSASAFDEAVSNLESLGDPRAIAPLAAAWEKYDRSSFALRAIVTIASQPRFGNKPGPFWDDAIGVLEKAVTDVGNDPRALGDAVFAADALGEAKRASSVPILVKAASATVARLSPKNNVRIAAIRALGNFEGSRQARITLVDVLSTPVTKQDPRLNAAAANALGELGDLAALQPLLVAHFSIPMIYTQTRRALVRFGPASVEDLIKIFRGRHKAINKLARDRGFNVRCRRKGSEKTTCKAPGTLRFRAAMLLGDFRATSARTMLVARLKKAPEPSYYDNRNGIPGPSDHIAILSALRAIGDPAAADAVLNYAIAKKTPDHVRETALDVYSWIAPPGSGLGEVAKILRGRLGGRKLVDPSAGLQLAAAHCYARLVDTKDDLVALNDFVKAQKKQGIPSAALEPFLARARLGASCQTTKCLAGALKLDVAAVSKVYGSKTSAPTEDERTALQLAVRERALLDLAKLGSKAKDAMPAVLALADSRNRVVRGAVLTALVRIGGPACAGCRDRLTEIVEAQQGEKTLTYLNADTRIVLHYFENGTGTAGKAKKAPR